MNYTELITEEIRSKFKPTWLYIKQHNDTGLQYFGKTIVADPFKYKGSGTRWLYHLNLHHNNVTTVWCKLFTDVDQLVAYAIDFSLNNNIVESDKWANLIIENGLDGGTTPSDCTKEKMRLANTGRKYSEETKQKIRATKANYVITEETRKKMSLAQKGRIVSEETKQKLKRTNTGKKHHISSIEKMKVSRSEVVYKSVVCPHCGKEGAINNMPRYHFDKCKAKK
jgi:hypothetical protein